MNRRQPWLTEGMWEACEDKAIKLDPALPIAASVWDASTVFVAQKQGERVVCGSASLTNPPSSHPPHLAILAALRWLFRRVLRRRIA